MLTEERPWNLLTDITSDEFILRMLELGRPIETTLVGVFDKEGRGSRQDIELPLHKDGEYSARKAAEEGRTFTKQVDYVGLYCLRGGNTITLLEHNNQLYEIALEPGEALVFDNRVCRHGRRGQVGDRVLLRLWITAE